MPRPARKRPPRELERRLLRVPKSAQRDAAFRQTIRQIPRGKVATYGQVAAAAGYPLYHRHVARLLRNEPDFPRDLQAVARHITEFSLRGIGVPEAFPGA